MEKYQWRTNERTSGESNSNKTSIDKSTTQETENKNKNKNDYNKVENKK
jgi:hypothetical protein